MLKYVNYFLIFFVTFLLDRITKYFVIKEFITSQIITEYFNIFVTFNRGIAWGIGGDLHDTYTMMLYAFIGCVLLYFIYYLKEVFHNKILATACMFIVSGGISNFIDRIWYGSVIDFVQLHYNDWYFPVFNVADVSITIGAIIFLLGVFVYPEK
jgi:signal peptidase II